MFAVGATDEPELCVAMLRRQGGEDACPPRCSTDVFEFDLDRLHGRIHGSMVCLRLHHCQDRIPCWRSPNVVDRGGTSTKTSPSAAELSRPPTARVLRSSAQLACQLVF